MKRITFLLLLAACLMILSACDEWDEEIPTQTPNRPKNATATLSIKATNSPTLERSPSTRASTPPAQPTKMATQFVLPTSNSLVRFRVGITAAYSLAVDPNLWEASALPTSTGVAYRLTYKKLPACQLFDEARQDAPQSWTHTNTTRALGGRTYTVEQWFDPANGKIGVVVYALDPRVRIELQTPAGNSECLQAGESVIINSTPTLLNP